MPAPGSFPDWDTNGTHTTAIVAGHATDGYVANEIPASNELNQVLMLLGLWIRWLAGFAWEWQDPFDYVAATGAFTAFAYDVTAPWLTAAGGVSSTAYIFLKLRVGQTIKSVGAQVYGSASGSNTLTVGLAKLTLGVLTTLETPVSVTQGASWTTATGDLVTPRTVASGEVYAIVVNCSQNGQRIGNVGAQAAA